jgi:hypothetical protein
VERASKFDTAMSFSGLNQVLLPVLDALQQLPAVHRDALNVTPGFGEGAPPSRLVVSNAALVLLRTATSARSKLVVLDDLLWLNRGQRRRPELRRAAPPTAASGRVVVWEDGYQTIGQLPVTGRGCAPVRARRRSCRGIGEH